MITQEVWLQKWAFLVSMFWGFMENLFSSEARENSGYSLLYLHIVNLELQSVLKESVCLKCHQTWGDRSPKVWEVTADQKSLMNAILSQDFKEETWSLYGMFSFSASGTHMPVSIRDYTTTDDKIHSLWITAWKKSVHQPETAAINLDRENFYCN